MKKLSLRTLIQNLYSLWVYDYHAWDTSLLGRIEYSEKMIVDYERWNRIVRKFDEYKGVLADSNE